MGLDMFIYKVQKDEIAYWRKANAIHKWFEDNIADGNIENCHDYPIFKEDLLKLKGVCEKVLNSSKLVYKEVDVKEYDFDKKCYVNKKVFMKVLEDQSFAEELLPTQSGFLYGTTIYGEYYVEDLNDTIRQIDKILLDENLDNYNIVYHAWW